MLSPEAMTLMALLRSEVGPDKKGIGPQAGRLMDLWQPHDPADLRPAMDELESFDFITIHCGIAHDSDKRRVHHGLRDVVSVAVTEAMQSYCDNLGL